MDKPLPFLKPTDMVKVMALQGKIKNCLLGGGSLDDLKVFWERFQRLYPQHPVYRDHVDCLQTCLPICIHADEGRCVKKEQILIVNWQSMIGKGTRLSHEHLLQSDSQGLNYMGKTYSTRFLVATMCAVHYRRKQKDQQRLTKLLDAVTDDLMDFYKGVRVSIDGAETILHGICLGFKGDWPMLAKVGNLRQHFGKKGRPTADSAICHLCKAGSVNVPYEDYDINAVWYASYLQERPWSRPPPFSRLPMVPEKELFFRFDLFHVMHKGIVAEFVGSAIDPRSDQSNVFFFMALVSLWTCLLKTPLQQSMAHYNSCITWKSWATAKGHFAGQGVLWQRWCADSSRQGLWGSLCVLQGSKDIPSHDWPDKAST